MDKNITTPLCSPINWEERRWTAVLTILKAKAVKGDFPTRIFADVWASEILFAADTLIKMMKEQDLSIQTATSPK